MIESNVYDEHCQLLTLYNERGRRPSKFIVIWRKFFTLNGPIHNPRTDLSHLRTERGGGLMTAPGDFENYAT